MERGGAEEPEELRAGRAGDDGQYPEAGDADMDEGLEHGAAPGVGEEAGDAFGGQCLPGGELPVEVIDDRADEDEPEAAGDGLFVGLPRTYLFNVPEGRPGGGRSRRRRNCGMMVSA